MVSYRELVQNCLSEVKEMMPWDLVARMAENPDVLIVDVREPYEFDSLHIKKKWKI